MARIMGFRIPIFIAGLLSFGASHSDERILSYHSEISVSADATMMVEETITVRAEGVNIRRGIFRDFPTDYKDRYGNRYVVDFEVIEVTRDGRPEPWHTDTLSMRSQSAWSVSHTMGLPPRWRASLVQ